MSVFSITLPIFIIIFIGWIFRKFNIADDKWVHFLNSFVYYLALPALIISSFSRLDFLNEDVLLTAVQSFIILLVFSSAVFLIVLFLRVDKTTKAALFLASTVGNTIYMGFPALEFYSSIAEDSELGKLIGVLYLVFPLLISIFVLKYLLDYENSISRQLKEFLINPLTLSMAVGIVLSFFYIHHRDNVFLKSLSQALAMLGNSASPTALFILGAFMYNRFSKDAFVLSLFSSFIKMIFFPVIILIILSAQFGFHARPEFYLLGAMPVAVTAFVISEKFKLNQALVGGAIFISTLLSFILIPIAASFF